MKEIILTLLLISSVSSMDEATVDLLTPSMDYGEACGYMACPLINENHLNVHIVPHTHGELGFTRTFYSHYTGRNWLNLTDRDNMKRMLDNTITSLWEQSNRKFTLYDTPYLFLWWANRDGTVRRMVYELLRQGRLYFVGGGWSMSDEATTSYHGIIDQFTYALRKLNATFLECGRPLVSWQSDVVGHSREFASLMAQMGFDGHFINPISLEDELVRMEAKSLEFIWRGSDDIGADSDIFTHKLFDGYWSPPGFCFGTMCDDPLMITEDTVFKNTEERARVFIKSMKERQAPNFATNHLMVMMGQRYGYHDASMWFRNIDRLIQIVNDISGRTNENITLYYSTPACYLKAVNYKSPSLTTKQDDFFPLAYNTDAYAAGIYTSRPNIKYMAREGHVFMQMAKQLQAVSNLGNNDKLFEDINWMNGVIQDHNIITGAMHEWVSQYYTEKIYVATQKATVVMTKALNKLRSSSKGVVYYRCALNESSCPSTDSSHSYIVIYNVLSWPVTIPVRLPVQYAKYTVFEPKGQSIKAAIIKVPDTILNLPGRARTSNYELTFLAQDLPPLGYRSYLIMKDRDRAKRSIIKKLNKNTKTKYFTKQTNNLKIDDESLLDSRNPEYEYFEETSSPKNDTEIAFDNITTSDSAIDTNTTPVPIIPSSTETMKDHQIKYVDVTHRRMSVNKMIRKEFDPNIVTSDSTAENPRTLITKVTEDDFADYYYKVSQDLFIKNKYVTLNLDKNRKINNIELSNGVKMFINIDFFYYASDDPQKLPPYESPLKPHRVRPGPYFFRPMDPNPVPIKDFYDVKVLKTGLVEEIQYKLADYASFTARIYEDKPYIEIDWLVGPIPIKDEIGKEVFIRYSTDLDNKGIFYTDSNGRQTMKRIRNARPTYRPTITDTISSNIYPITSKIHIEDLAKNIRFSILNDRAQGGCSLNDGDIDIFVHRRILTDDTGFLELINATAGSVGVVVRGTHYLYVTKAHYRPNKIFEKKFAKEIELVPKILVSSGIPYGRTDMISEWSRNFNEFSAIRIKLPLGVHILTIEQWNNGAMLMRFENYFEKDDVVKNGVKRVFVRDLFVNIEISSLTETTLAANIWLKNWVPLHWKRREKFVKNFNRVYGSDRLDMEYSDDEDLTPVEGVLDSGITLKPQQIRTFVAEFKYVGI